MKKYLVIGLLLCFVGGQVACTRASPKCKQNAKRIKKMRKNNSNFNM